MSKNKKVPELRFKGFTEDWELKRVDKIAPLQRGFDLPKDLMINGPFPVVMSNGINGFHSIAKVKGPGVITGRSGTIGKLHYSETDFWPHNTTLWVIDFNKNNPLYVYYMYLRLDLKRFSTGSGVPTLNRNDVHEKTINICKQEEQKKISKYFQCFDNLFNYHQLRLEKLLAVKTTMLEKMFPKEGTDVPEIRFKGFNKKWKRQNLSHLTNRYDNLRVPITASNRIPGNTPYYGANGIQDHVEGYTHDGEFILIAEDGANDIKNYPVQYVKGKIWVNNHAHVLQEKKDKANLMFLKYAIARTNIEPYLVGGGRAKLNAEIMMGITIIFPDELEEQKEIGSYFFYLDSLISIQKQELDKLKNIKNSCLEKMLL